MEKIVIYPRGFAGFDIGLPVRTFKPTQQQVLSSVLQNRLIDRSSKSVISNTEIESLWKSLVSKNKFISNFAVREAIIKNTLSAIKTDNFLEFIELQENNPYLDNNGIRFINDTLNFINGRSRSLNINNWLILLAAKDPSPGPRVSVKKEDFFNVNIAINKRPKITTKSTMVQWLSKPNGFEDMLGTMHILFGDSEIL